MSDQQSQEDLDKEWKPKGRPQSIMAQNFSASLNSAFAIDDSTSTTPELNNLAQSVSEKKAAVDSQTSELQALEARIKEMDKRLEQKRSRTSSPARVVGGGAVVRGGGVGSNIHEPRRSPLGDTFGDGGVNAPGAAGNYYGSSATRSAGDDAVETRRSETTAEPLVDRTINPSSNGQPISSSPPPPAPSSSDRRKPVPGVGGMEHISASTKSRWMPDDASERVSDV